jgi:uncharacterized lipoprotein YddW (UPF0748 family)
MFNQLTKPMRMRPLFQLLVSMTLAVFVFFSCKEEEAVANDDSARLIESFTFNAFNPAPIGEVDNATGAVRITVPFGTDLKTLTPTIVVSPGATIDPASGVAKDFSKFVIYTVTAANGAKKVYTAVVTIGPSNVARINSFRFSDLFLTTTPASQSNNVVVEVPFGTNLSAIKVEMTPAETGSTVSPASGSSVNFSQPVSFEVTAPDAVTKTTYTVQFTVKPQETGIRGVWVTNVDSDVLTSQAKIQAAIDLCDQLNINTIFAVTYNKAETTYPSQVMNTLVGKLIGNAYTGRDPLRELIDAAHTKNIKVFAWFEYGFAAFNGSPGPILQTQPTWAAINSSGNAVVKNGFHWLNSLHPDVQQFMTDLVLEVVTNYPDIDGVQGDDRLPAMPTEGGYDTYTVNKYKAEHAGVAPPTDRTDDGWVQWRADILNAYAQSLYSQVKQINPNCLVAMSPSPLDFGLREYLQDYTKWVKGGYCDIVSPQLYRRDDQGLGVYAGLLGDQLSRVGNENINTFYPGILSYLGSYIPSEQFMADMIRENRKRGVMGEVHFFYNTLLVREKVLKVMYPAKAIFPVL